MRYDSLDLEKNYAGAVSLRLERYSQISYSPFKALFRCPICGDSAKNKYKRRAYFLEKEGHVFFYCHNGCGGFGLVNFLNTYHPDLYNDYRFDIIRNVKNETVYEKVDYRVEISPPVETTGEEQLSRAEDVPEAKEYLTKRKIPIVDIWYIDKFYKFINSQIPGKFPETLEDHPRIIFPLRRDDGSIFGYIARDITNKYEPKYLTIKLDEDHPKIYGLDRYNPMIPGYIVEGPIDSLFLGNALALAGTDADIDSIAGDNTIVLDNQPRSPQVLKKYEKYIKQGHKIVIWPSNISQKDINDMIMDGYTQSDIEDLLSANTYQGLNAKLRFAKWRKTLLTSNKQK